MSLSYDNCIHREVCKFRKRIVSGRCGWDWDGGCEYYVPSDEATPYVNADWMYNWLRTWDTNTAQAWVDWTSETEGANGSTLDEIISDTWGNGLQDEESEE